MNKQSNTYTIIYIVILVAVVGAALAIASMALASRQQANSDADKMGQILKSVHITADGKDIQKEFNKYITDSYIVDIKGKRLPGNAFNVDIAEQSKIPANKRQLPVYVCDLGTKGLKYILPVYGSGLWGPIWGYVAVNADGRDVYGAYFAHQGETPGLGAEIEKPDFSNRFDGKTLWRDNKFDAIQVVKNGTIPSGEDAHYVDGVSGGTITSKGVSAMLGDCLTPYATFLKTLNTK